MATNENLCIILNLWPQIRICGHKSLHYFESVATNSNMWTQIFALFWICGHKFEYVDTDLNSFPLVPICENQFHRSALLSYVPLKVPKIIQNKFENKETTAGFIIILIPKSVRPFIIINMSTSESTNTKHETFSKSCSNPDWAFKPLWCINASFYKSENRLHFAKN